CFIQFCVQFFIGIVISHLVVQVLHTAYAIVHIQFPAQGFFVFLCHIVRQFVSILLLVKRIIAHSLLFFKKHAAKILAITLPVPCLGTNCRIFSSAIQCFLLFLQQRCNGS